MKINRMTIEDERQYTYSQHFLFLLKLLFRFWIKLSRNSSFVFFCLVAPLLNSQNFIYYLMKITRIQIEPCYINFVGSLKVVNFNASNMPTPINAMRERQTITNSCSCLKGWLAHGYQLLICPLATSMNL